MPYTPSLTPSPYQQAVMDHAASGQGSVIICAVAGSGKTKTIELVLPVIPEAASVRCLAFNSAIAKELNARIEKLREDAKDPTCPWYGRQFRNVMASTFHSLGVGAVARKLGCGVRELQTDDRKSKKLCDQFLSPLDNAMYAEFICKLVGHAKGKGIGVIAPNTADRWYALIQHHDMILDSEDADEGRAIELAQDLLQWSNKASIGRSIDFDDMLYLPLLWNLRLWQNDFVLVDEAQDVNPVRRALVKKALRPGGRSYWFGDEKQAIYGFTGASHDALDVIRHEFGASDLPLTVCYRCAQSVVEHAKQWVPYIEAHDAAPQGQVSEMSTKDALAILGPHDAILCRNTAPLVTLAFKLIAQGRGCVVLGRDIGQGLVTLVKKMKTADVDQLSLKLDAYREREVTKYMGKGEEMKAEAVSDRVACVDACIEALPEGDRTVGNLIRRIEGMFADTNGCLMLSTIHKSKGREFEQVGILRPDLLPSKWARQDWAILQERNLAYVACTRAKTHLIYIHGE